MGRSRTRNAVIAAAFLVVILGVGAFALLTRSPYGPGSPERVAGENTPPDNPSSEAAPSSSTKVTSVADAPKQEKTDPRLPVPLWLGRPGNLQDNCAMAEIPEGREINTSSSPESRIAHVYWLDYQLQQDVDLALPYEPESDFEGCSESAKVVLRGLKRGHDKMTRDMCEDFRAIIGGRKPLPEKAGETPDIEAAKRFVAKNCQ